MTRFVSIPTVLVLLALLPAQADAKEFPEVDVSIRWSTVGAFEPEMTFFADRHYAAVRTQDWKLIVPVRLPWQPMAESAALYSLAEDPSESYDLAAERKLGPVGEQLLSDLSARLARPEAVGAAE